MSNEKQPPKESQDFPPLSLTRESIRVSAATLVSMVATIFSLWFFFDDHWITKKHFESFEKDHTEMVDELKELSTQHHAETKAELMKFVYYQRMITLKDMIRHLMAKKVIPNSGFTPVDEMTLQELESEFVRINQLYNTEQLKPK